MADRFPLIANTSANQIQEIGSGDNLDLTGNNIIGVSNVDATNISVTGLSTFSGNVYIPNISGVSTFSSNVNLDSNLIVMVQVVVLVQVDYLKKLVHSGLFPQELII